MRKIIRIIKYIKMYKSYKTNFKYVGILKSEQPYKIFRCEHNHLTKVYILNTGIIMVKCPLCGIETKDITTKSNSIIINDNKNANPFIIDCTTSIPTPKEFLKSSKIQQHNYLKGAVKIDTIDNLYRCNKCGAIYSVKRNSGVLKVCTNTSLYRTSNICGGELLILNYNHV
jgi:uncharacterized Zn finger protein